MDLLVAPALIAAALLAVAGAQKALDPSATVGALRALGLPGSPALVRAGAAGELSLGVAAIVVGGPVLWGLVAASYLAFAAFVAASLRAGGALAPCGCFGRQDTLPHGAHVALNLVLAGVAGAAAMGLQRAPVEELAGASWPAAAAAVALAAVSLLAVRAGLAALPRTPRPAARPATRPPTRA